VTSLLRGAAGELSDLIEIGQTVGAGNSKGVEAPEGETRDLPPGSKGKPHSTAKSEADKTEYSYLEDEAEEEKEVEKSDKEDADKSEQVRKEGDQEVLEDQAGSPKGGVAEGPERVAVEHRNGVILHPARTPDRCDPHYLSKALQLRNCGLEAAKADREKREERLPSEHRRGVDRRRHPSPRAPKGSSGAGRHKRSHDGEVGRDTGDRRGRECAEPPSPERPPIVRRPRTPKEERQRLGKRKKNNKCVKRRERGRQFRGWQEGKPRRRDQGW